MSDSYKPTFNRKTGTTPKVDGIIIYNFMLLGKMSSSQYTTEQERKFKYMAIKDHILFSIDPLLIPKVTDVAWADRYREVIAKLKNVEIVYGSLDTFAEILQQFLQLFSTILYSHGYYELETIKDADYEQYLNIGDISD